MNKFIEMARRLSKKSAYHHKIGAVVVKRRRAIGFGFNKPRKTHPKSTNPFKTVHAELDAIIGLTREELNGAEIYVVRERASGSYGSAKPCQYCEALLKEVGIKVVYYTTDEGIAEALYS
jgi:deoxycytidylate deaminase